MLLSVLQLYEMTSAKTVSVQHHSVSPGFWLSPWMVRTSASSVEQGLQESTEDMNRRAKKSCTINIVAHVELEGD